MRTTLGVSEPVFAASSSASGPLLQGGQVRALPSRGSGAVPEAGRRDPVEPWVHHRVNTARRRSEQHGAASVSEEPRRGVAGQRGSGPGR